MTPEELLSKADDHWKKAQWGFVIVILGNLVVLIASIM